MTAARQGRAAALLLAVTDLTRHLSAAVPTETILEMLAGSRRGVEFTVMQHHRRRRILHVT